MNGIVYLIRNKENGMAYVGQTIRAWAERKAEHLDPCNYETPELGQDLSRLGEQGFEWRILREGIRTQGELNAVEQEFIAEYNSVHPNGYNQIGNGLRRQRIVYPTPPKVDLPQLPANFRVNRSHVGLRVYYRWAAKHDEQRRIRTGKVYKVGYSIVYITPDDPNAVDATEWIRSFDDVLGLVQEER